MSSKFRLEDSEVAGSGPNFIGLAGEALTNRALVRINAAGLLVGADASAAGTLPAIGITLAAASTGQNVLVLQKGWVGLSTWTWTPGGRLYATDVAGVIGAATGTVTQEVGVASTATQIWFDPQGLDTGGGAVGAHILATTGPHTNTLPLTDLAVGVQGEIIHRSAADWAALGVGAAGLVLTAGGAGADVAWAAAAGGLDLYFIPVPEPDTYIGTHAAVRLTDGQDILVRMEFLLPTGFDPATWSCRAVHVSGGAGNMWRGVATNWGAICSVEDYDASSDSIAAAALAVLADDIQCSDLIPALTGSLADDLVGMEFTRYASNANDTVNADCYFLGVVIGRP